MLSEYTKESVMNMWLFNGRILSEHCVVDINVYYFENIGWLRWSCADIVKSVKLVVG